MMKSLFLCHGGPTLIVEDNSYTDHLKALGKSLKPKAIVVFTAHWESQNPLVSAISGNYKTIHDFSGFPRELYEVTYPAPGSPELAERIVSLFDEAGINSQLDTSRGLDHGAWDVLYLMFPEAQVPVVQISVNPFAGLAQQVAIGQALRTLGDEDILVIGSGSTVHNLRMVDWNSEVAAPWAMAFDGWLLDHILTEDYPALFDYRTLAPHAVQAVPREEHLVPLFIAMGAGNSKPEVLHHSYVYGTLSYISIAF